MKFHQPKNANYYDLVKIPHGHIPAPMIKFWDWLPIPEGQQRTYNTFHCPTCGSPNFFKTGLSCNDCQWIFDDDEKTWKRYHKREQNRKKWKRFEHAILPILVILGQAKYMVSERLTYQEQVKKYGPPVCQPPFEEDVEEIMNEPTGENCAICGIELTYDTEAPDHPLCCEEHGDYLPLCNSCNDFWMMNCDDPANACIREWFKENTDGKLPVSILETKKRTTT